MLHSLEYWALVHTIVLEGVYWALGTERPWFDVTADGQQFLLIRTDPASRPVRLDVILNWADEVK